MSTIPSFQEMPIWQRAVQLSLDIAGFITTLPKNDSLTVVANLQDAALSIPIDLARSSKSTKRSFRDTCLTTRQTIAEIETELIIISQLYDGLDIETLLAATAELETSLTTMARRLTAAEQTSSAPKRAAL